MPTGNTTAAPTTLETRADAGMLYDLEGSPTLGMENRQINQNGNGPLGLTNTRISNTFKTTFGPIKWSPPRGTVP